MQREVDLPVSLNLCAKPGTKLRDITTVVSHPNPLGQTRMWMAKHLPDAMPVAANSTADAAHRVLDGVARHEAQHLADLVRRRLYKRRGPVRSSEHR